MQLVLLVQQKHPNTKKKKNPQDAGKKANLWSGNYRIVELELFKELLSKQ